MTICVGHAAFVCGLSLACGEENVVVDKAFNVKNSVQDSRSMEKKEYGFEVDVYSGCFGMVNRQANRQR